MKTVLITGAAVRIGREIALSLADDGWDIAIHYNRSEKEAAELASLLKQKKRKVFLAQADLQDAKAVAGLIPALVRQGAALDCLINNASLFERDTLATLSSESWRAHNDINLLAPLCLIRDFARHYGRATTGISSISPTA